MAQGFFLHVAKISTALDVASFAPASAIAQARVVIHLDRAPRGFARVTRHAVKRRSAL